MSLVPGTGGDLDSIGEMVVDTDELEENEDAPSDPEPVDNKKKRRGSDAFARLRLSLKKIVDMYDPENDKTVVSINVAVRARPFSKVDRLAFFVDKNSSDDSDTKKKTSEGGELRLLNLNGKFVRQTRYAFTYAWWSAYNYKKYLNDEEDLGYAENMNLTTQYNVYEQVGRPVMSDLLHGHSVVLFAYGLSGSGKTYTVFGPDDPKAEDSWYKHKFIQEQWGLFPRVAFHIFVEKRKHDGWRITIKYFQNVVNTVRDLLSRSGEEKSDKTGLHKDSDGFMDVTWASKVVVNTWEELRSIIQSANSRKAISPTQFNHQSTRGHCILIMEVETTNSKNEKQKGRLYVCDLAGAEPAGDIVYAQYKRNKEGEDVYVGKHPDESKTKALRAQGQKINLSLSEITNFFRKMAAAVKSNRLKPGQSIPGCNNYFLGRFLKETMLKSKTYLFCAVRPETKFLNYTISTLQFAATASVVKLKPKKPLQRKMTKHELNLFQEIQKLKAKLEKKNALGNGTNRNRSESSLDLLNNLKTKRQQLDQHHIDNFTPEEIARKKREEVQQQMLRAKGIEMASTIHSMKEYPHFKNIDEDEFMSKRYVYLLSVEHNGKTVFGKGGNVEPSVHGLVANHCSFAYDKYKNSVTLIGGKGAVLHNGDEVIDEQIVVLKQYDRVAISKLVLLFFEKTSANELIDNLNASGDKKSGLEVDIHEKEKCSPTEPSIDFIMREYELGNSRRNRNLAGKEFNPLLLNLQGKMRELNDLLVLFRYDEFIEIELCMEEELDDDCMNFSSRFRCRAICSEHGWRHTLDEIDLDHCLAIFSEEKALLKDAFENGRTYTVPETHNPFYVLFDHPQRIGYATVDIFVPNENVETLDHFAISPEDGVPIQPLTKEHGDDPVGHVFLKISFSYVELSNRDEDSSKVTSEESDRVKACTISIYHADLKAVVKAIDGRYKFGDELFEFHGHFSGSSIDGNEPDFDYVEQHIFYPGKITSQKLNINFYCVPKRNFHGAFPISTENQKILRSFELNNEIAAAINGESLFDKNFQLQQEINDIKKQARVSKLKIALGKTKYDGLMKRYDAEVRRLKDEHKKELDQKDEQMQILAAREKKKSLQIQQMEELQVELIEAKTRLIETQHNLDASKTQLQISLKETEIVRSSLSVAERNAGNLKEAVTKLKHEISDRNNSSNSARKRINELEAMILQLRTRISYIDQERQKLRKDRDQTHFELKKKEFENNGYKDDLDKKNADAVEMNESFKKTLQSKMSEVASLYEEIMEKDATIASLNAQLREVNKKCTALKSKFDNRLSQRSNMLINAGTLTETAKRTIQNAAQPDDPKSGNVLAKQYSSDFGKDVTKKFNAVADNGAVTSECNESEIKVKKKIACKDVPSTIIPKKDILFDSQSISNANIRQTSGASKKQKNIQKNASIKKQKVPIKISLQHNHRKAISHNIASKIESRVKLMSIETLGRAFIEVKNTKLHSTKELRSILYAIVRCAILNQEKSHLYVALLEKLFARTVVTQWQQSFIRTGVIDGKFFWQDGSDGLKFGPFSDSLEALQHAVRETNPKVLLHQVCLIELERIYAKGSKAEDTVNLIAFMSELFDYQMLPLVVMEELLKQLVADDSARRKLQNDMSLKQEDLRLISTVLEIAYRCLLAGSVNFGSNIVSYLDLLDRRIGSRSVSRRDTFLLRKLRKHLVYTYE